MHSEGRGPLDAGVDRTPAHASTYAEAALRCGMKAPEIEARLIRKGLSPSSAEDAVRICLERRIHRVQQSLLWADRRRTISRVASLVVATVYLIPGVMLGGLGLFLRVLLWLLYPLACIWFPETFGRHIRRTSWIGPHITSPTPGPFVTIAGWVLLITPVVFAIVVVITKISIARHH